MIGITWIPGWGESIDRAGQVLKLTGGHIDQPQTPMRIRGKRVTSFYLTIFADHPGAISVTGRIRATAMLHLIKPAGILSTQNNLSAVGRPGGGFGLGDEAQHHALAAAIDFNHP